ncbi:MAG: hypothetical protein KKD11_04585 [Candidatus Omnitrophica bacterium]|nr:hypothetical protein [Candidatus Omnitrophota bacterium]
MRFGKDYNVKILSMLVAVTFLLNSTAYTIDLPKKAHLRIPLTSNGKVRLKDRIMAALSFKKADSYNSALLERRKELNTLLGSGLRNKFKIGLLGFLATLTVVQLSYIMLEPGDKPTRQIFVPASQDSTNVVLDSSIIEKLLDDREFNLSLKARMLGVSENNKDEFALIGLSQGLNIIDNLGISSREAVPVAVIDLSPQGEFSSALTRKMVLSKHGSAMADIVHQIGGDKIDVWTISAGTKYYNGDLDMSYLGQAVDFATQEGAKVIVLSISGQGDTAAMKAIDNALDTGLCITEAVGNDGV